MFGKDKKGLNCFKRDQIDQKRGQKFCKWGAVKNSKNIENWIKGDCKGQNRATKTKKWLNNV